jgi:hypothetical protein
MTPQSEPPTTLQENEDHLPPKGHWAYISPETHRKLDARIAAEIAKTVEARNKARADRATQLPTQ